MLLRVKLAILLLMMVLPLSVLAQDDQAGIITDEAIEALDEIIVLGEPTLRLLREDVYRTEESFYELFNSLNEGKQFDVVCFYRKPVGSHISRRVCEPNFYKSEYMPPTVSGYGGVVESESSVQSISNMGYATTPLHSAFVQHKTIQMNKIMAELVAEYPELHRALMEFADAQQTLSAAVRDRCADPRTNCDIQ